MCGFTGFVDLRQSPNREEMTFLVRRMTDPLTNRGPDDAGEWVDERQGVALGFRRLAILDLSSSGHQPMLSASGRYVIAFNGEAYNFQDLRKEIETTLGAKTWRGHSDTEVVLEAIETWGLEKAVKKFIGMFAFALWDRQEQKLFLVRDRLGVKPLYYGWADKVFLFGSELKAIRAFPKFRGIINRDAIASFMRYNYIPAPHTIYQGFYKLEPGTFLTFNPKNSIQPQITAYWSMKNVVNEGQLHPFEGTDQEAIEDLNALLKNAIGLRMISDVPLGAFLSGGIDSSLVIALMQAQSPRPIKTFSIGFHESQYNEAHHAKEVAQHLGTDHTELYVTPEETMAVIPKLPFIYDEPFADSSQIPTYLVSSLARKHVTVSLSGDGGDELFAGYNRYFWTMNLWNKISRVPSSWRRFVSKIGTTIPLQVWDKVFSLAGPILPAHLKYNNLPDKLMKLAHVLSSDSPEIIYQRLISHWENTADLVPGSTESPSLFSQRGGFSDFTSEMMYFDTITYLPDDILVKVDRASMSVSLESREPLLDHRLVEFSWKIPLSMKIRQGQGKWLLRQVLNQYVPQKLIDRPKMGFGVPIDVWLRGPLKNWAESLLDEKKLNQDGFLNTKRVSQKWAEHISGKRNWQYQLWNVLMLQAWLSAGRI